VGQWQDAAVDARPPRRIALVDDDEWVRRGRGQALAELAGIEVVLSVTLVDALRLAVDAWDAVDTALIDAHDPDAGFDEFPGVRVVERIRARAGRPQPVIVVITGHVLDDMLRLRMAEAGADFLFGHAHVRTVERLHAVATDPASMAEDAAPDPGALEELGLTTASHPNAALQWVEEAGLAEVFVTAAEGESQKVLPTGRRQLQRSRQRVSDIGGIRRTAAGQRTSLPEWQQIVDVITTIRRGRGARKG